MILFLIKDILFINFGEYFLNKFYKNKNLILWIIPKFIQNPVRVLLNTHGFNKISNRVNYRECYSKVYVCVQIKCSILFKKSSYNLPCLIFSISVRRLKITMFSRTPRTMSLCTLRIFAKSLYPITKKISTIPPYE